MRMRNLGLTFAVATLLAGTSAQAATIEITGIGYGGGGRGESYTEWPNGILYDDGNAAGDNPLGIGYGASLETKVNILPGYAEFESGVAVGGPTWSATSTSGLDITIANDGAGTLNVDRFGSTISDAGMGFYLQDRDGGAFGNNVFTGYGQTQTDLTFQSLYDLGVVGNGVFARSDFTFDVTSGESVLYTLSGYIAMGFEDGVLKQYYGLGDAAGVLDGFETEFDNPYAWAFKWAPTDFDFAVGQSLGEEQSLTLQYRTTVSSWTSPVCFDEVTCLVAYSGFGDPIGRGGGISFARGARKVNPVDICPDDQICGINFRPTQISRFEVNPDLGPGVPEPGTWALMILGFGLSGAALRRRRLLSYS